MKSIVCCYNIRGGHVATHQYVSYVCICGWVLHVHVRSQTNSFFLCLVPFHSKKSHFLSLPSLTWIVLFISVAAGIHFKCFVLSKARLDVSQSSSTTSIFSCTITANKMKLLVARSAIGIQTCSGSQFAFTSSKLISQNLEINLRHFFYDPLHVGENATNLGGRTIRSQFIPTMCKGSIDPFDLHGTQTTNDNTNTKSLQNKSQIFWRFTCI